MGKFLRTFNAGKEQVKERGGDIFNKVDNYANKKLNEEKKYQGKRIRPKRNIGIGENVDDFDDFDDFDDYDPYVENVSPSQKPASFHHFILENLSEDIKMSLIKIKWNGKLKENLNIVLQMKRVKRF